MSKQSNPVEDFFSAGKDCEDNPTRCGKHALASTASVIDLMSTITCSVDGVLKDSIKDMITAAHTTTGYENPGNAYVTSVIRQSTDGADAAYIEGAQETGALARDRKDESLPLKPCLELVNDDNLANGVYAAVKAGTLTSRGPVTSVEQVKKEMMSTCVLKAVSNSLCTMGLAREAEAHEKKKPDPTGSPTPHNSDGIITPAPTPPYSLKYACRKDDSVEGGKTCKLDASGKYDNIVDCNKTCGKN